MFFRVVGVLISLLFISPCQSQSQNSEEEARILLNQALIQWYAGDLEKAESKFITIENNYLHTEAATESIVRRAGLKIKYKRENNVDLFKRAYRGEVSTKVFLNIDKYYQKNNTYPNSLSGLAIDVDSKYLSLCTYKKALFEYGYKLDCVKADQAYGNDKRSTRKTIHKKNKKKNEKKKIKELSDFPKANTTWGEKLNPSRKVPEKGFYAYYINTNTPSKIVKKEAVNDVSINYSYDKFHKINSKNFGGYWVGYINLLGDETKTIAINQSWAKTRLIIDGFVVYEGGSNNELLLNLKKGRHLIEVEYVNNWHTTEFSLTFFDEIEKLSLNVIQNRLAEKDLGEYEIYTAGVYESSNKDLSVTLNIEKTPKPVVLFLSSYSPVKWNISNPHKTTIKAIIYSSYAPLATVFGDLDKSTILLYSIKRIGTYRSTNNCRCTAGTFHCGEASGVLSTKKTIEGLFGHTMTGFSGKYSASSLKVPQLVINDELIKEKKLEKQKNSALRKSCSRQINPDFEKMFEKDKEIGSSELKLDAQTKKLNLKGEVSLIVDRAIKKALK
jgi:hypothetical protein